MAASRIYPAKRTRSCFASCVDSGPRPNPWSTSPRLFLSRRVFCQDAFFCINQLLNPSLKSSRRLSATSVAVFAFSDSSCPRQSIILSWCTIGCFDLIRIHQRLPYHQQEQLPQSRVEALHLWHALPRVRRQHHCEPFLVSVVVPMEM